VWVPWLEARGAWETFFRRAGEDLAGDVEVEGAAPGAVAPVQALLDAAVGASGSWAGAGSNGGGGESLGHSGTWQGERLEVERVLSLGYRGRLASGAAGPNTKEAFCSGKTDNTHPAATAASTVSSRRDGGRTGSGVRGTLNSAATESSSCSASSSWCVLVIPVDTKDAAGHVLSALNHGIWLSRPSPKPVPSRLPSSPSSSASYSPRPTRSPSSPSLSLASSPAPSPRRASGAPPPLEATLQQSTHRRVYPDATRAYSQLPTRMLLASKAIAWLRRRRRPHSSRRRRSRSGSKSEREGLQWCEGEEVGEEETVGTTTQDARYGLVHMFGHGSDSDSAEVAQHVDAPQVDAPHVDARVFMCAEAAISVDRATGGSDTNTYTVPAGAAGAGCEWAKDPELHSRARQPDVAERLWVLPEEERLVAVRRMRGTATAGLLQAVMERRPPPGPGDLLRRAYLDLNFNPGDGGGGGKEAVGRESYGGGSGSEKGERGDGSSSTSTFPCDDVPLHFVPATVGDLLSIALDAGLVGGAVAAELRRTHVDGLPSSSCSVCTPPTDAVESRKCIRRRLYVLETPARAEQAVASAGGSESGGTTTAGYLHALDGDEVAELLGAYLHRPGAPAGTTIAATSPTPAGTQSTFVRIPPRTAAAFNVPPMPASGSFQLPTAQRLWPGSDDVMGSHGNNGWGANEDAGGGVRALALVYNEAEARPETRSDGMGPVAAGLAARPYRVRPAFVAMCRLPGGATPSLTPSASSKRATERGAAVVAAAGAAAAARPLPDSDRTGKHSVSSWIRRQYPPSPLLSRVWDGSPHLLDLLQGGELHGVLSELMGEAARAGGGVGGGLVSAGSEFEQPAPAKDNAAHFTAYSDGDLSLDSDCQLSATQPIGGGKDNSSTEVHLRPTPTTLHAYPLLSDVHLPAPRDWAARDFELDEAAAVLDDAEDELELEREVRIGAHPRRMPLLASAIISFFLSLFLCCSASFHVRCVATTPSLADQT